MNKKKYSRRKLMRNLKIVTLVLLLAALAVVVSLRTREVTPPASDPLAPAQQTTFRPAPVAAAEPTPSPVPTPTPEPTPVPDPEFYTLSLIGDCSLAEDKSKRGWGTAYQSVVGDDYGYPFKNTKHIFEDDYMTLANLECTLTDNWYDTIEWFGFLAPAAYVNILTEGNVDFVTLANNHTMDYGAKAYGDMIRALDSVNLPYAGENETYIFQRDDGLIVGVYCLYNDKQPTKALLDAGLKKLRDGGAQLTIAALHWGVEGAYSVSDIQTEMGHYARDAGFNVVYGSHPHRLEPVEKYN
ncbi:MAG: CapA family protein, partial [Ruminococcaceae bacterium]|nr:CapA family protein [Oscillospiraceae bacterium]